MAKTTQLNRFREKRLRNAAKQKAEDKSISSYFYPKSNLYTRQEFELLDTIYSDEPPTQEFEMEQQIAIQEGFWPKNKEGHLSFSSPKGNFFSRLVWFLGGVLLTSAIWLIYFQLTVHEISTKSDTQIVIHKSTSLTTDKTIDKGIISEIGKQEIEKEVVKPEVKPTNVATRKLKLPNWFSENPTTRADLQGVSVKPSIKPIQIKTVQEELGPLTHHVVGNGDSLWYLAKKYYLDPSPQNIEKIMKANDMRKIGVLQIGEKLVIPQ